MSRINEEYKKGFELGLQAKDENEKILDFDVINMFRSDEEKKARQKGYEAGVKERELRKRGIR